MARAAGMPAVAVTDTNNLFCALEFSEYAAKAGIQPIVGCQISLRYLDPEPGKRPEPPAPIVLLAQSEAGYQNLMRLNSVLYLTESAELPQVEPRRSRPASRGADLPVGRAGRAGRAAAARRAARPGPRR